MQPPQNTPTSTNVELKDPRIPEIIDKRLSGQTWSSIADDLQINRKTLYDIRQKEQFQFLIRELVPKALKRLDDIMEDPEASDYKLLKAVDETLKMWRSIIPKRLEMDQTTRLDITIQDERRKLVESVIREVSPGDYRVLEDIASRVEGSEE